VRATKQHDPVTLAQPGESEWAQYEAPELKSAPHSFIIHRGTVGRCMKELMQDLRHVMEPYTASNLKVSLLRFRSRKTGLALGDESFIIFFLLDDEGECPERLHFHRKLL